MKNLNLKVIQKQLDDLFPSSNVLNTEAGAAYNEIVAMIAANCQVPVTAIFLTDDQRQFFINKKNIAPEETSSIISLCRNAVRQTEHFYEISDTWSDELVVDHPAVSGSMQIRYFASVAITTSDAKRIGVICILSTVPNTLSKEKKALLETTAMMVGKMLEYSQFAFNTKENVHQLKQDRGTEKNMLSIVANHVLKPIESLKATVELCGYEGLDEEKLAVREFLSNKLSNTINTIENILEWGNVLINNQYKKQSTDVNVQTVVKEVLDGFLIQATLKNNRLMNLTDDNLILKTDANILKFILKNLLNNANTVTENGTITVYAEEDVEHIMISICDSGEGLNKEEVKKLLAEENAPENNDCAESNTALSFRLAKDFVEELNASIQVKSEPGEGTAIFLYFAK